MAQKESCAGFVEVLILLIGLTGAAAFGIMQTAPHLLSSSSKPRVQPTILIPSPTITPHPTASPETMKITQATGIDLTEELQIKLVINGEEKMLPLTGIEKASTAASCLETDTKTLSQKIKNKPVYIIDSKEDTPSYVFLDDLTFLNKYLITTGWADAADEPHLYHDEFFEEQKARKICIPTLEESPTPTLILPPSVTSTPTPNRKPSPTKVPTQPVKAAVYGESTSVSPTPLPTINLDTYIAASSEAVIPSHSNNADLIFQMINLHRTQKNLPLFEKDAELCKLAQSRAPELYNEIFVTGTVHAGLYSRNIPYWITENMASYGSEEAVVNWWLNSPIHRNAIEGTYKYSCGACLGNSCTQLFTNYASK